MAPFFCPTKPPDLRTHHQPAQSTYENTGKKLRILTGTNTGWLPPVLRPAVSPETEAEERAEAV
jgi:hypothetical protein